MIPHQTIVVLIALALTTDAAIAQTEIEPRSAPKASVLDDQQWKQLDASVERGLEWLISQQQADGSFKTLELGQPAVTGLCLMAFLAQGESPIDGQYQQQLSKAVNYIANQQKRNGLLAVAAPDQAPIPRVFQDQSTGQQAVYNHAIASVALSEAYGQCLSLIHI